MKALWFLAVSTLLGSLVMADETPKMLCNRSLTGEELRGG